MRVLRTRSHDEAGLEAKDRGAVAGLMLCYAQRSAAGTAKALSAHRRITDTMPVPLRARSLAPLFIALMRCASESRTMQDSLPAALWYKRAPDQR